MVNFENIGFSPELKKAIKAMGYVKATEVQERTIPLMISGKNIVSRSFTGSGKTAAFGIALSERIITGKSNAALILCPTRELALQVKEEIESINSETGLGVFAVYGGRKMSEDDKTFRKRIDILCATPGRLLDHFEHRRLNPKIFDTVVLDEADRMLDMGFIKDIKHALSFVRPVNTHLFSATLTGSVAKLIDSYIPSYEEVLVQEEIVGKNILQEKQAFSHREKFERLLDWARKAGKNKVLVFMSTKRGADMIDKRLREAGFRSASIHGDKSQKAREVSLKKFKEGNRNILIATDVAARGLQIDNVEFVINYDRAKDADTHKHRIGRTGRMGEIGTAITFIPKEDSDRNFWKDTGIDYRQLPKRGERRAMGRLPRGRGPTGRMARGQGPMGRGPTGRRGFSKRDSSSQNPGFHGMAHRKRRPRRNSDTSDYVCRS